MSFSTLLSVGFTFNYPLLGGESLYDLLPTFNEKFGLELTEEEFDNVVAVRQDDGLIGIDVISYKDSQIYQFVNEDSKGIFTAESVSFQKSYPDVILTKPINFSEELDSLSVFPVNTAIQYNLLTAPILATLARLLTKYSQTNFSLTGNRTVIGSIIRYLGEGKGVPQAYGEYPDSTLVCIVDVPLLTGYQSYCLRTEIDYVALYGD